MKNVISEKPGDSGKLFQYIRMQAGRLHIQVVFTGLSLFFAALVIIGVLLVGHFRSELRNQARQKAVMVLKTKEIILKEYFNNAQGLLKLFAQGEQVPSALQAFESVYAAIDTVASNSQDFDVRLSNYYTNEYLLKLNPLLDTQTGLSDYFPQGMAARYLQYHYLVNQPGADKSAIESQVTDVSGYAAVHGSFHRYVKKIRDQLHLEDVFLITIKEGNIVYSVSKNPDFATNLLHGPYRNSGLGEVYLQARLSPYKDFIASSGFAAYSPALGRATAFMAAPVYLGDEKIGVLAFRLSVDFMDGVLYSPDDKSLFGTTGRVNLVNTDYKCVNNSRFLTEKPEQFFNLLDPEIYDAGKIARMKQLGSTSTLIFSENEATVAALKGFRGESTTNDEFGKNAFSVYAPISLANRDYALIFSIGIKELYSSVTSAVIWLSAAIIVFMFIAWWLLFNYTRKLSGWASVFQQSIYRLARGEVGKVSVNGHFSHEFTHLNDALNSLSVRLVGINEAIGRLSSGQYDQAEITHTDTDQMGNSIEELRQSLLKARDEQLIRAAEDEKRNWTTRGIALFSDLLRANNENINKLSANLVRELVEYMQVVQAGIFVSEEREDGTIFLELAAAYAYDRQKFLKKEVFPGEGLVGTCYLERKTIYLKEIPAEYIKISSGFGDSQPKSLLIVPIIKDNLVLGVIELSSLNEFEPHEIEFVEKLSESIGATMISARITARTARLLEESKLKAEEMAAQEEEMRQNLEELQATQEEMRRIKEIETAKQAALIREMEANKQLLNDILNRVPAKIFLKDHEGRFVLVNNEVAAMYGVEADKLYGTSDFDHHPSEDARRWKQEEEEIKAAGGRTFIQEELFNGKKRYLQTTKLPFDIHTIGETGLLGIQFDVTEIKDLQNELAARFEEMEKLKQELSKESSLMKALMESVPEHIYFKDRQSKFVRISRSMINLFKVKTYEDIIGKSDFDFFGEEHARPAYEDEQKIIATEQPIIDLVEKEVHKDGSIGWVSTTKMPLRAETGEIIGTFGISKDISGLKNLELKAEEVQKYNEELTRKLREKESELKAFADAAGTKAKGEKNSLHLQELEKQNKELQQFRQLIETYRNKLMTLKRKK